MKCVGYPNYDNCRECELINELCHPEYNKTNKEREKKKKAIIIKEAIEVNEDSFEGLIDFLISRESDIARDIENFGYLKAIFKDIFEEEAEAEE